MGSSEPIAFLIPICQNYLPCAGHQRPFCSRNLASAQRSKIGLHQARLKWVASRRHAGLISRSAITIEARFHFLMAIRKFSNSITWSRPKPMVLPILLTGKKSLTRISGGIQIETSHNFQYCTNRFTRFQRRPNMAAVFASKHQQKLI